MKRSKVFLFVGLSVVFLGLIALGIYIYLNKIAADTLSPSTNAGNIQLIVVAINPQTGEGALTGYNSSGPIIITPVNVGTSPTKIKESIYQPSIAGCGTSGAPTDATCMTSLGVYSAADWTKPLTGALSGEWFLNLDGNPTFGGDPVCPANQETKDGKKCRHLGIHFSSGATHGCIGIPMSGKCTQLKDAVPDNSGIKVIVTDYAVRGTVAPVDPESYDANFKNPNKIDKGHFISASNATGGISAVKKTYNFGNYWVAEVAAPNGKYTVSSSASGYKTNVNSIDITRGADHKVTAVNGQSTQLYTEMTCILALDKVMMAMNSTYMNNTFYKDGYLGYFRASGYDKTSMTVSGNTLNITIGDAYPSPKGLSKVNGATPKVNAKTEFGVVINATPWHDLGYGGYFKSPLTFKEVGSFIIDYDNLPKTLSIPLNTAGLTDDDKARLYKWGVSIYKKRAIGHGYNDYIGLVNIKSGAAKTTASVSTTTTSPVAQPGLMDPSSPTSGSTLSPSATGTTLVQSSTSQAATTTPSSTSQTVWYNPLTWFGSTGNPTLEQCQIIWTNYTNQKPDLSKIPIWDLVARTQTNSLTQQKAKCDSLYPNN